MPLRRDALDGLNTRSPDAEVKRTDATSLYGAPLLRGGVFMAAKMRRSVSQSISNGVNTKVDFNVKVYDNWDKETQANEKMLDFATEKIEIRRAGIYWVSARVVWDDPNAGDVRQCSIQKNGVFIARDQAWVGAGNAALSVPVCKINEPMALVRGDDLSLHVLHNRGESLSILAEGESPYLAVTWMALP